MLRIFLFFIITLACQLNIFASSSIRGNIKIDNSWAPTIYLSLINSFDDLNTASYDFLIFEAGINENGCFTMDSLELPDNDRIYRLHICKKGDPISTIIMGGKDENFIHFIMNNQSEIKIGSGKKTPLFKDYIYEGHLANNSLKKLFNIQNELLSPPELPSMQNRELLQKKVLNSFRSFADTSSFSIIKLLSLYFIDDFFSFSGNINFIEYVAKSIQEIDTSSPYYHAFIDKLEYTEFQSKTSSAISYKWFILIALILIIAVLFLFKHKYIKNPEASYIDENIQLLSLLSVQEKKVLDLLKEGKSNKEISLELYIEVSTVKSHLNKIYSRLGVKSRKEIIHGKW